MQLKIQSLLTLFPALPSPDAQASRRERIVTVAATALGVLTVASIAVLMGLID